MISLLPSNSQLNFYISNHIFNLHDLFYYLSLFTLHCGAFCFSYRHNIFSCLNCMSTKVNFSHYLLYISKLTKGFKGNFNSSISMQRYWFYKDINPQLTSLIQAEWRVLCVGPWHMDGWDADFSGVVLGASSRFAIAKISRKLDLCGMFS